MGIIGYWCPQLVLPKKVMRELNSLMRDSFGATKASILQMGCRDRSSELETEAIVQLRFQSAVKSEEGDNNHGICAICVSEIKFQETALIKGCGHAYCVTCILQWATYKETPTCPQCKHPFQFLNIHRSLDGSLCENMFEESVCLLLRAPWFTPLKVEETEKQTDEVDDYYQYYYYYSTYENDEEDLDEAYYGHSSNLRIGNRRWGDNGYVRSGRVEARPVYKPNGAGTSGEHNNNNIKKKGATVGRRAKRTLKREAADKLLARSNHQG
ncbi:E3 ubiquitin-protein ligase RNF13-like [Impatiens glandulifera]|uniref:E3 ubiquitin-protein ligase RNF13-like n=1 Tax=Impatiens glandulifera TaxID=253017 RepID=UPI001FB118BB|nr:E3 ubiquitin-protein ligase RNF13-like [Impatiens glandulifera]